MSQEVALSFKRTLPAEIADHMDAFAYVYVVDAQENLSRAARMYGITPMHARRIVEAQPDWSLALVQVMQSRLLERVGEPRMRAMYNVGEAMVTHPQAELLAIPLPWTREVIDERLSLAAKDCIKSMKWGMREVFSQELQTVVAIEVLEAVQWNDQRWEATLRVLEAEGVKKVRLMPVAEGEEDASGFGGVIINFIDAPVD